ACEERLVVMGASAGGPTALATILGNLPRDFAAAIVIVQHLDAHFVPSMVTWLNDHSNVPVQVAASGESPRVGHALISGKAEHLAFVSARTLGYTKEPQSITYRPSIDVFFQSVARHWKGEMAAALLSGMGRDGASGLKTLREAGALT